MFILKLKYNFIILINIIIVILLCSCRFTKDININQNAKFTGFSRGINLGNALEAHKEGEWGVVIKDDYFKIIKNAGFDSVRIPIKWSAHALENLPYTIEKDFFDRVDHVVKQSLFNGLYTVINIHHYDEITKDPEKHKERFIAIWKQIASHYKDFPQQLYFELLNEPNDKLNSQIWNDFLNEAIATIRKTNPQRIIVVGGTSWNNISELEKLSLPEKDENIIATFHYYSPFKFTHQGASWVKGSEAWLNTKWMGSDAEKKAVEEDFDKAAKWAEKKNKKLLLGEFGAFSKADMESRVRWTSHVAREAEERNIAWMYWEFCSGFGAYDNKIEQWRPDLLKALVP